MNDELQVIDLELGDGKAAVKGALITTQYRGWLEDGTEFDSSYSRGKPFQCVIGTGRVIKGWDQGIMGMPCGHVILSASRYGASIDEETSEVISTEEASHKLREILGCPPTGWLQRRTSGKDDRGLAGPTP